MYLQNFRVMVDVEDELGRTKCYFLNNKQWLNPVTGIIGSINAK
jgi:hypothetical protein